MCGLLSLLYFLFFRHVKTNSIWIPLWDITRGWGGCYRWPFLNSGIISETSERCIKSLVVCLFSIVTLFNKRFLGVYFVELRIHESHCWLCVRLARPACSGSLTTCWYVLPHLFTQHSCTKKNSRSKYKRYEQFVVLSYAPFTACSFFSTPS